MENTISENQSENLDQAIEQKISAQKIVWYKSKVFIISVIAFLILAIITGLFVEYKYYFSDKSENNNSIVTPTPTTSVTYSRQELIFDSGRSDGVKTFVISIEIPSNAKIIEIDSVSSHEFDIQIEFNDNTYSLALNKTLESFPNKFDSAQKIETQNFEILYRVKKDADKSWMYSTAIETEKDCYNGVEGLHQRAPCGTLGVVKKDLFFFDAECKSEESEVLIICDRIVGSVMSIQKDWKAYSSDLFAFKYPSSWEVSTPSETDTRAFNTDTFFVIDVERLGMDVPPNFDSYKEYFVSFDGIQTKAKEWTWPSGQPAYLIAFEVQYNGKRIGFRLSGYNPENQKSSEAILFEILNSFKFKK